MTSWFKITDKLLENNHINIPIEKRLYLSFTENEGDKVDKNVIIDELKKNGILNDDPRIKNFISKLKILVITSMVSFEEFKYCLDNNVILVKDILQRKLIIPYFKTFTDKIEEIYNDTLKLNGGACADYIPQLKRVDPDQYGISICTIDGQRYNIGDTQVDFSVQSCCKPINYGIALEELSEEIYHSYVGREPSGQSFNELALNKKGLPHNPLINAGAIMTSSLIKKDLSPAERFEYIVSIWDKLCGGLYKIGFNNPVYLSEKNTADRNFALAYFMKEINENKPTGFPEGTDINDTLDLYFQCCSIEINTEILAIVASTLANDGINPFTGTRVFSSENVKNILSMMLMCGMYDYSGEFAFKIGIPSKSGVSGPIMMVIPNVMGMVSWSPSLDDIGNSYRGVEFCKKIGETFNFHIFDNDYHTDKINPLNEQYDTNTVKLNNELCSAACNGDLEHIKILFNRNIDFNISDYDGRTALHLAVCEKHVDVIKFLVNIVKVNVNKKDRWGRVAKDEATDPEILECFKLYI